MIKRTFYAWHDAPGGVYRISLIPPDGPIRPSLAMESVDDVKAYAQRKRAKLIWHPPLNSVQALVAC